MQNILGINLVKICLEQASASLLEMLYKNFMSKLTKSKLIDRVCKEELMVEKICERHIRLLERLKLI